MSEDDSRTFIGRDDSQDESKEHRLPCVAAEENGSDSSEMAVVNDDNNSTSRRDNQEDEEGKTQQLPLQDGYHHPSTLDDMRTDEGKEDAAATFSKEETLPSSLSMEESSPSPTRPQRTTNRYLGVIGPPSAPMPLVLCLLCLSQPFQCFYHGAK